MVEERNVNVLERIVTDNKLLRSVKGLFIKEIVIDASRHTGNLERGLLLSKDSTSGLYEKFHLDTLMASDASSGQKDIVVADASGFKAGDVITITDSGNSESKTIDTVVDNTVTVTVNLVNSYTVANGGDIMLESSDVDADAVILLYPTTMNGDTEASVVMNGVVIEEYVAGNLADLDKSKVQRLTFVIQ